MRLLSVTARGLAWGHLDRLRDRIAERLRGRAFSVELKRDEDGAETVALSAAGGGDASVFESVGDGLAEFIVHDLEPVLMEDVLESKYGIRLDFSNRELVLGFCEKVLERMSGDRKAAIARAARAYFESEREMELEGFLVFRLRDYMTDLFTAVTNGWDHYEAYRQYDEFVTALKLMMFLRPARVPLVHLFRRQNGEFVLTDQNGVPLGPGEPDRPPIAVVPEGDDFPVKQEQLVSTLISVSPRTIRVHVRRPEFRRPELVWSEDDPPDEALLRTLNYVFVSRIEWCEGCPLDNAPLSGIISHCMKDDNNPDGAPRKKGNLG